MKFWAKFIKILLKNDKILKIFAKFFEKMQKKSRSFLLKIWDLSGAKECKSCRSRKMLQNASFLAIVAVDTDENEPLKLRWLVHYFNNLLIDHPAACRWSKARHNFSQFFTMFHNFSEARSPLYQRRFSRLRAHFAAFFKIYKIYILLQGSKP